jgi:hypothetical protein
VGAAAVGDPTGITLVIIVVFFCATLWCGARRARCSASALPRCRRGEGWAGDYLPALRSAARDGGAPLTCWWRHTHGPHGTAWWVNGIQLKLGLLGKVIGFSSWRCRSATDAELRPQPEPGPAEEPDHRPGRGAADHHGGPGRQHPAGPAADTLDRYADTLVADIQRAGIGLPLND